MRAPVFFTIPAGTEAVRCRGCPKWVYWIRTRRGKRLAVDASDDGCLTPTEREAGRGVAHIATCAQAERFRRRPTPASSPSSRPAEQEPAAAPAIADQISMFDRSADVVAAVTLIEQYSHIDGGRILQQPYMAREAASRAVKKSFGQREYPAVREAVATLETFHGERW